MVMCLLYVFVSVNVCVCVCVCVHVGEGVRERDDHMSVACVCYCRRVFRIGVSWPRMAMRSFLHLGVTTTQTEGEVLHI